MPQPKNQPVEPTTLEHKRIVASHRISMLATQISVIAAELSKLELAIAENGDVSSAHQKLADVVAAAV